MSVCLSVCLSVCMSACLSVCVSVCLSVCPPVCLFVFRGTQQLKLNCAGCQCAHTVCLCDGEVLFIALQQIAEAYELFGPQKVRWIWGPILQQVWRVVNELLYSGSVVCMVPPYPQQLAEAEKPIVNVQERESVTILHHQLDLVHVASATDNQNRRSCTTAALQFTPDSQRMNERTRRYCYCFV
jgi:hypothetical protein